MFSLNEKKSFFEIETDLQKGLYYLRFQTKTGIEIRSWMVQ